MKGRSQRRSPLYPLSRASFLTERVLQQGKGSALRVWEPASMGAVKLPTF